MRFRTERPERLKRAEWAVCLGATCSPGSGTVVAVMVEQGARVAKGAPLMVLEAMKMEHTIAAPADGTVAAVHFRVGDRVQEGADLVELDLRLGHGVVGHLGVRQIQVVRAGGGRRSGPQPYG